MYIDWDSPSVHSNGCKLKLLSLRVSLICGEILTVFYGSTLGNVDRAKCGRIICASNSRVPRDP